MKKIIIPLLLIAIAASSCNNTKVEKGPHYSSGIQKEDLGRGLIAYLESDPLDVTFDLYRNCLKLNGSPLADATFFTDSGIKRTGRQEL